MVRRGILGALLRLMLSLIYFLGLLLPAAAVRMREGLRRAAGSRPAWSPRRPRGGSWREARRQF